MSTGLSVNFVPVGSVGEELLEEWRQLAAEAIEPNPFFAPQILVPAARWLPRGNSLRLAFVKKGSQLLLAMPLIRSRYRRLPVTSFNTWRHTHRFLGTPLLREGTHVAPAALLKALMQRTFPGWVALEQIYVDGPVAAAFRAATAAVSGSLIEFDVRLRPGVRARSEATYLRDTLSSRHAKTLRRQRRNLEHRHGPLQLLDRAQASDSADVDIAVAEFMAMEAAGWKGRAGTALNSSRQHAEFWRQSCRELARSGNLRLWELASDGEAVAWTCGVRFGDTLFHLKTTYDETLRSFSPGVQLELELLHAFHAEHAAWLDSCTGHDVGVSGKLYPDAVRIGDLLIGLNAAGRALVGLTPHAARAWRKLNVRSSKSTVK